MMSIDYDVMKRRHVILSIFFLLWIFLFTFTPLHDSDIFFNLKSGDEIRAHGTVFSQDIFSYTRAGEPWTNRLWLFQVFVSFLYGIGSWTALVVAKSAIAVLIFLFLLMRYQRSRVYPAIVLLAFGVSWLVYPRMIMRPELMTYLCIAISLHGTLRYQEAQKRWVLWVMPIVFFLWVNMHGLYIIGLCIYVVGALWYAYRSWGDHARRFMISAAVSCVTIFMNPYGVRGVLVPFEQLYMLRGESFFRWVGELMPLWRTIQIFHVFHAYELLAGVLLLALISGVSVFGAWRRKKTMHVDLCIVSIILFVLSWVATRNVAVYALVSFVLIAEHCSYQRISERVYRALSYGVLILVLFFCAAQGAGAQGDWRVLPYPCRSGLSDALRAPVTVCDFLDDHGIAGRVYGNSGVFWNYYLWRYGPQRKVFVDGRLEVYGEDFFKEVITSVQSREAFFSLLNRFACSTIVIDHTRLYFSDRKGGLYNRIAELYQSPDWVLSYVDSHYVIFIHVGDVARYEIPHLDLLQAGLSPHDEYMNAVMWYAADGSLARMREYYYFAKIASILGWPTVFEYYVNSMEEKSERN